jgi:hypothetical protein
MPARRKRSRPRPQSAGKQIVGITSSGIEIIGGSRSAPGPIGLSAAAPVSLIGSPVVFTSPDAAFIDVTGDGLTDLVLPTASEIDVLPAAGAKRFRFPVVTTSLGSSAWTPATAQFGNIDGVNGRDYVWADATGAWIGLASTTGSFGTPTKQLSWTLTTGAVGLEQLDLTPGTDVGVLGSTTVATYSALGLGTVSSIPNTSPLAAPGSSWEMFSGFMPVDHKLPVGTDPLADGIWRLTAQGSWRVMPWGLGLDGSARVVPLGDLTGDGQTDFAAIAQGALWLFGAGPNGPVTIAASGVPAGASVLAAGELDENPGAEVVIANAQQLVVYALSGAQLVPRATASLGATPDPVAALTASSQLPRSGTRRSLVVQLTSFAPPQ